MPRRFLISSIYDERTSNWTSWKTFFFNPRNLIKFKRLSILWSKCVLILLYSYWNVSEIILYGHQIVYYGYKRKWHIRIYSYFQKIYINTCSYFDSIWPGSIIKYMFLVILITTKYIYIYYYILQNRSGTFEFPQRVAI